MHAHARVHAFAHRSSTGSQGCASVHYMCECVCCYYFVRLSESHSSPPQLKGVRVISACARTRVYAGAISLISALCLFVCLSAGAHRDTKAQTHTQATLKTQANTCQVMIENPSFDLKGGNTIEACRSLSFSF